MPGLKADGTFVRNPDGTVKFNATLESTEMYLQQLGRRLNPETGQIEYTPDYMTKMGALTGFVPQQPSTPGDSGALGGMPAYPVDGRVGTWDEPVVGFDPVTGQPVTTQPTSGIDLPFPPVGLPPQQQMTAAEREASFRRDLDLSKTTGVWGSTPTQSAYEYGRSQTETEAARLAANAQAKAQEVGYYGTGTTSAYTSPTSSRDYATVKQEYDSWDPLQTSPSWTPEQTQQYKAYGDTLKSEYESFAGGTWGIGEGQKTIDYRDYEQRKQQQQWTQQTQFPAQQKLDRELGAMSAFGRWRKPNPRWM